MALSFRECDSCSRFFGFFEIFLLFSLILSRQPKVRLLAPKLTNRSERRWPRDLPKDLLPPEGPIELD